MTNEDVKKVAKVINIVVSKKFEDFEEKIRRIIRSELEYKFSNEKKVLHDDYPSDDKIEKIRESASKKTTEKPKDYVSPTDMIAKMRKLNEEAHNPNKDVYIDENENVIDMTNNEKVKSLKNRDYSQIIG